MQYDPITSLASIKSELEDIWMKLDLVYAGLEPARWSQKFGKTWIYADQPYHLAYFDQLLIPYISKGRGVPKEEQILYRTLRELNEWNARQFAKRPPEQTVAQSMEQMRAARETIRKLMSKMSEKDLDGPAWMPLFGGWATVREHLHAILLHTVAEYVKLWIRTDQRSPGVSPSGMHLRLDFMMNFMSLTLDKAAAANKKFTMVWNFVGPGGGAWTFRVVDGSCAVNEELVPAPDLMITLKPETLQKIAAKMEPPPLLMLKREMKVKGLFAMGAFAKLFPEPKPDQVIQIGSNGAVLG
ncbi:MAG: SCP2 sterol-binding domain-containing protein [Ignavibacteriales bacterium]|nr:SCP2 sterol-binding domain-containing protein [Ignavibacteriales bacterium]